MGDTGKAVFLSYASQDAGAAKRICEALRAAGVEVWFDQNELRGGEAWDQSIRRQIKECALFVPIVSATTQERTEGYFRLEWRLADQRTHLMGKSRAFLVPVCIDDTPDAEADVPESFLAVQWTRLRLAGLGGQARLPEQTGGEATEVTAAEPALAAFAARVKDLLVAGTGPRAGRVVPSAPDSRSGSRAGGALGTTRPTSDHPTIPDFELLRLIGSGSYGDVWLARGMTGLHRAVKVVWRDRFETDEPYERELRGLKEFAAISLKTEGQMALLHLGRNDAAGFFYYVMELADDASTGRTFDPEKYVPLTLKEWRQRKGRVPAADVIAAGVELAGALAALHGRGLVHRDIKPSNAILVNDKAKLADIGLVTTVDDARTFIGTSGYVPPEGPGSPAADVFALGRVLYELATGLDRDEFPKLPADLERLPDRRELMALNDVILRACAPSPEKRYRDAGELLADLETLRAGRRVRRGRFDWKLAVQAAAVVVGLGAVAWRWWPQPAPAAEASGRPVVSAAPVVADDKSIAILPFENRSENKSDSYLADGIHEDVVTNFANVRGLKVTSLASALRYRGTAKSMRAIGEELGVAYILTGSLRREGNRIRLSAQLVETRTDRQVWAKNYDREFSGAFALQSDLAGEIVPTLHLVLSPDEAKAVTRASTASGSAYDLFLRARTFAENGFYGKKEGTDQAEALLRQAVAEDPGFVRAWVELAKVHTDRYQYATDERSAVRIAAAEEAVATARRLAPEAPEVRLAAGRIRHYCYEDYPGALVIYRDILASHPNYPEVRVPLAFLHRRLGRWQESLAELREARRQEPGNRMVVGALLATLEWVRRYDEMDAVFRSFPAEWNQSPDMVFTRALHEFRRSGSQKLFQDWLAALPAEQRSSESTELRRLHWAAMTGDQATVMELLPKHGLLPERMALAIVPIMAGQRELALRLLAPLKPGFDRLKANAPLHAGTWRSLAMFHALHGDRAATLEAIERARQLFPESVDAVNGPSQGEQVAMALAWLGEKDAAIREIERLVKVPAGVPVWKLKHTVSWLPLRGDPRVQAIIDDPANSAPLVGDEAPGVRAKPEAAAAPAPVDSRSIAVLPFENRGDANADAYFADGLHEDLLTRLSGIGELKVIARTSLLRYQGTKKSPREIGAELGVAHVLEGSIRRAASQVRVTARLVEAATDRQVWAQSYDRELTDVFLIQGALATDIVAALQLQLSPAEKSDLQRKHTTNESAYDLYLRAREIRRSGAFRREGVEQAEALLRQAIAVDPEFVQAWAELAQLHSIRYFQLPEDKTPARLAQAEEAIAAARRLAPEAPEVLLGLAQVRNYGYRDYAGALYYLGKLVAAHPNYPDAHQALGRIYRRQGRWIEAQAAFRRVWELDPANIQAAGEFNYMSVMLHRYAEVDAALRQMQVFWPDDRDLKYAIAVAAFRRSGSTREFEEWLAAIPPEQRDAPEVLQSRLNWALWRGNEKALLELVGRHGIPEDNLEFAAHLIHTEHRPRVLELLERQKSRQDRTLASDPLNGRAWATLAQIHALRGERAAALDAIARSRQLLPESVDALNGAENSLNLALALLWLGDIEPALTEVERLVKTPGGLHAWVLRDSLVWRPVRDHPRIVAILNDPASFQPLKFDEKPAAASPAGGGSGPKADGRDADPKFRLPTGSPPPR